MSGSSDAKVFLLHEKSKAHGTQARGHIILCRLERTNEGLIATANRSVQWTAATVTGIEFLPILVNISILVFRGRTIIKQE